MSDLTEWIKEELYPSLFDSIDTAFPEHNFARYSGGWRSKTNIDGSAHPDRKDKTVITKQYPGRILEHGGENISLLDYVMRRDNSQVLQAVEKLAAAAGVQIPKGNQFNPEQYREREARLSILEACRSYFAQGIESPGAADVLGYLTRRGYSLADIKGMDLGYIPSQQLLKAELLKQGFRQLDIDRLINFTPGIGSTHQLTIPYTSGGVLKGFKFRTIGEHKPKYYNSTDLDKAGSFFNLLSIKGDKDLLIVEGEIDALHATVKGENNVVAATGSSISPEQVRDAIKKSAKSFTICFDTEPGKEAITAESTFRAISILLSEGVTNIYVAILPDLGGGKTDPDRLIKERGISGLIQARAEAVTYYQYWSSEIISRYSDRHLEERDKINLLDEIVQKGIAIASPVHKDLYAKEFLQTSGMSALGISADSLKETIERLAFNLAKDQSAKKLNKAMSKAQELTSQGNPEEASKVLEKAAKEAQRTSKRLDYADLLEITTEQALKEEEANQPDSLDSGFTINKEALLFPAGAVSVYAAATGHGKTLMLINTVLNVAIANPDKQYILFTYEERATSIIQYFLNAYADIELNNSSKTNRRLYREYFRTGETGYISTEKLTDFSQAKTEFFKDFIEPGRIRVKYIDYDSEELNGAIEYMSRQPKTAGVFIDYFQLLNLPSEARRGSGSRQEELKQVCLSLKSVAVSTGLPIVLAAQFNREVTNLERLHPTNIGEAGDIERIVNTLVGVWSMYKKPVLKGMGEAEEKAITQKVETVNQNRKTKISEEKGMYIEILKSRDLASGGWSILDYNGNTGRIRNGEYYDFGGRAETQYEETSAPRSKKKKVDKEHGPFLEPGQDTGLTAEQMKDLFGN